MNHALWYNERSVDPNFFKCMFILASNQEPDDFNHVKRWNSLCWIYQKHLYKNVQLTVHPILPLKTSSREGRKSILICPWSHNFEFSYKCDF